MKKIYFFILVLSSLLFYSQPYSVLLKNTDWTIMSIQWNGIKYNPPAPLATSGKVHFNYDDHGGFTSIFFNSAEGKVSFAPNNEAYFNAEMLGVTLAEYGGENAQIVNQFDLMTTSFYFGFQPTDQFDFEYEEVFSTKKLTVTNPLGNKIIYSNMLLGNSEVSINKGISIYPNPAKDEFFINSLKKNLGKLTVEIFDESGKLVSGQNASMNTKVNIQPLPNGIYLVKVSGSGPNFSAKLIVQK